MKRLINWILDRLHRSVYHVLKAEANVMAAMLMGLVSGEFRMRTATDGNRIHRDRAPEGSPQAIERIAAAEAKRQRKLLKRRGQTTCL